MFDFITGMPFGRPVPVLARAVRRPASASRQDQLLDEALKGTFPASDPVSVARIS